MIVTAIQPGTLIGVGVGPGDPELMTLKAARIVGSARIIAHFAKAGNSSHARRIVAAHVGPDTIELPLLYPVTTESPVHGESYREQMAAFYAESAARVAQHLDAGCDVVVLSEGDPLFYGSYMHLHIRLAPHYRTQIVPGVTGMAGCWSSAATPIAQGDDVLSVLPGTLPEDQLAGRIAQADALVIMKVGRNLPKIRRALATAGRLDRAVYVERGTMTGGVTMPLTERPDDRAPYFSIILVPGWASQS
jgi:precorrin-2/cobalt-factor-2 C20-methyltransferase